MPRHTLARAVTVSGTALHTGGPATAVLRPAPAGGGISFRRSDQDGPPLRALAEHVSATDRRTALGGAAGVQTIEHVLAATWMAGLDDVLIEVDGPELPIMDGSAAPFVEALRSGGRRTHDGPDPVLPLDQPLDLAAGRATYTLRPAAVPRLTVTVTVRHPQVGRQTGQWALDPDTAAAELAGARTFGFRRDAEALRARGLARGASEANVVVLTDTDVATALRWPDEFVRHKALDLLGDLLLAGGLPAAEITAVEPSHAGNVALAQALRRRVINGGASA